MTVARKVVRGAIFNSLSGYGLQVISLVYGIVLGHLLTPAEFGKFLLATAITLFYTRIRLWGFESLLLAKTNPDDTDVSTQFWLSLGLGTLTVVLIAITSPLLAVIFGSDVVPLTLYIALISLFESFGAGSTSEAMLAKDLRFGIMTWLNIMATLLGMGATIAAAALGWSYNALLLGYGVRILFYFTTCLIASPHRPKLRFSRAIARDYFSQGRHLLWGGIGTFLAFQYDDLAVGTISGQAPLGLYGRAYTLSQVPMSLVAGVLGVAAALYAQVKEDRAALSEAVRFTLDAVALIVLPASAGLALIAPEFLALYGPEWVPAAPMLQLLLIYSMVRPMNDAVGSLAATTGRTEVIRRYGLVQAVVMVTTCTVLTWLWGPNGAAISAGITVCVAFGVLVHQLLFRTVDLDYRAIFGPPLLSVLVGVAVALGAMYLWKPDANLLIMLYKSSLFSVAFGLSILIFGRKALIQRVQRIYGALLGKTEAITPIETAKAS